jgi:hypothetical protein
MHYDNLCWEGSDWYIKDRQYRVLGSARWAAVSGKVRDDNEVAKPIFCEV